MMFIKFSSDSIVSGTGFSVNFGSGEFIIAYSVKCFIDICIITSSQTNCALEKVMGHKVMLCRDASV